MNKCITNLNHLTTVADVIDALLDDLSEKEYLTINDCCLYVANDPYLFPLKSTDFIKEILSRYSSSNIYFKLSFKRNSSPSRFAQRKKLHPISTIINPYEQLRIQKLLIEKQQLIINQLTKVNDQKIINSVKTPRQSRQNRSSSQVRFRLSTVIQKADIPLTPSSSIIEIKSILKKSPIQRSSSIDRDIDQLIALKPKDNSFCTSDDDNLSNQSTTDSCLGSLSSNDSVYHNINQHHFETLV